MPLFCRVCSILFCLQRMTIGLRRFHYFACILDLLSQRDKINSLSLMCCLFAGENKCIVVDERRHAEENRHSYKEAGHALPFVTFFLQRFFTNDFQDVRISSSSKNASQSKSSEETAAGTKADLPMVSFSIEMGNDAEEFRSDSTTNRNRSTSTTILSEFSCCYR